MTDPIAYNNLEWLGQLKAGKSASDFRDVVSGGSRRGGDRVSVYVGCVAYIKEHAADAVLSELVTEAYFGCNRAKYKVFSKIRGDLVQAHGKRTAKIDRIAEIATDMLLEPMRQLWKANDVIGHYSLNVKKAHFNTVWLESISQAQDACQKAISEADGLAGEYRHKISA